MKTSSQEADPGSLDWHIDNYRGPLYWLRVYSPDPIPDLLLTHHNTRIHRFDDSELDHLRVDDLAREGVVWLLKAKTIGAAVLDSLESRKFPTSHDPLPDSLTEEWFVRQAFMTPSGEIDFVADLPQPNQNSR